MNNKLDILGPNKTISVRPFHESLIKYKVYKPFVKLSKEIRKKAIEYRDSTTDVEYNLYQYTDDKSIQWLYKLGGLYYYNYKVIHRIFEVDLSLLHIWDFGCGVNLGHWINQHCKFRSPLISSDIVEKDTMYHRIAYDSDNILHTPDLKDKKFVNFCEEILSGVKFDAILLIRQNYFETWTLGEFIHGLKKLSQFLKPDGLMFIQQPSFFHSPQGLKYGAEEKAKWVCNHSWNRLDYKTLSEKYLVIGDKPFIMVLPNLINSTLKKGQKPIRENKEREIDFG